MANEEMLGPRKTMFVLVIVVGCFAVLWPRILSPLLVGHTSEQLKPNQFDREAGCCEVMFESELAVLELINEVCSSAAHADGKLSPYAAAECRKAVNETCGVDIVAFLKRTENVGKTSKKLVQLMKNSNSSCLKEYFGVPVWNFGPHLALNYWTSQDTVKQERPSVRAGGPHPALRERGRAIPPGAPAPSSSSVAMPPHVRVRSSPLSVYYELDIKPPPIPGMRPPLGSPGGPVPAPKSSMGFVMPIYTICIIVFFVYTLSKILFKRTGAPYETVLPDPQFRRRVFRDDSRTSPDKLVVTAISGLVAEVQQQMEASYVQNQQRQDVQDNHTRPYTNGTILHNSGPVHIVASEYREASKETSPEPVELTQISNRPSLESNEITAHHDEPVTEFEELKESITEQNDVSAAGEEKQIQHDDKIIEDEQQEIAADTIEQNTEQKESILEPEILRTDKVDANHKENDLIKLLENKPAEKDGDLLKITKDFLEEEAKVAKVESEKRTTPDLLEEAIKEDAQKNGDDEQENASVKVVGMEVTAHTADGGAWPRAEPPLAPPPVTARPHEAEEVKSIFLETEIPQQSRVLVADFGDKPGGPALANNSSMVVSGKMTLSLIQDAPRETPERDPESTVDDFTTASAVSQPAAEKNEDDEVDESDEELGEEIEIEEIEEEIEEEEEEEEEPVEDEKKIQKKSE